MVGISIACNKEWECVLERFGLSSEDCGQYPYNTFVSNVPVIMNNIFDNYLEYALRNRFNWKSQS